MNRDKQVRRNAMRKWRAISVAAIAAAALANLGSTASAQGPAAPSHPPADMKITIGAPAESPQPAFRVQPRLSDLPPGVAENETRRTEAQKQFNKRLQVCRNC